MDSEQYFTHNYKARHNRKLTKLIMKHGLQGIGAYWCIVEMLYEENGYIPLADCERIAFELRTQSEFISEIIHTDLFEINGDNFTSHSVLERLKIRKIKKEKARKSAEAKWKSYHANAERTQSERNANKGKERKDKEKENNNNPDESGKYVEVLNYFNNATKQNLKLTPKKRSQLKQRLSVFSVDEIKSAVDARLTDPWFCGENETGRVWANDWDSLFRNDEKIERAINLRPKKIVESDHSDFLPKY